MTRFKGLPHWCMTGTRPAFYDTESATAIEMVAKLYGSYSELVEDYNKYVDEINKAILEFETGVISDTTTFKETITKIVHDYIKMIDDKVKIQDDTIADAVSYMKSNIVYAITETVEEMKTSGELAEIVVDGFNDLVARVTTTEETITSVDAKAEKNIDDILDLTNRVKTAENTVSTMEGKVNQSVYTVDSLSKEVGNVRTDMNTLSNEVASVKSTNTNINRNMTTLTGRVDDLENNVNVVQTQVTTNTNNITTLEERVGTLETTGGTGTGVVNGYDVVTGGEGVKTGYKVDGKDVYVRRFNFGKHESDGVSACRTYMETTSIIIIDYNGFLQSDEYHTFKPYFISDTDKLIINVQPNVDGYRCYFTTGAGQFTDHNMIMDIYYTLN